MDKLARYYTVDAFSKLLVSQFSNEDPFKIIDLGVGGGSLIRAAASRWSNASYIAADIDKKSIEKIKNELPFVNSFHLNTLKNNVIDKLNIDKQSIDIAVCNPPYLKVKNGIPYEQLFNEAQLQDCQKLRILTSDIIFLARNLQFLKSNGELGIILPDSLVTGKDFLHLRSAILKEHCIKAVIELPEKIFSKTEALTHILLIEKNGISTEKSQLFLANKKGEIIDSTEVLTSSLEERMDFKYHSWKKRSKKTQYVLGDLDIEIKRGSQTHKNLKTANDSFIHTTEIIHGKYNQTISNCTNENKKYLLTQKGDILLSRVGCIGKVCMISRGRAPFSDCIYRLRVPQEYRDLIWESLISKEGQEWFKANSHGVCAKVISKRDLLKFPIKNLQ